MVYILVIMYAHICVSECLFVFIDLCIRFVCLYVLMCVYVYTGRGITQALLLRISCIVYVPCVYICCYARAFVFLFICICMLNARFMDCLYMFMYFEFSVCFLIY